MGTPVIDQWCMLDPALFMKRCEDAHGSAIFGTIDALDTVHMEKKLEAVKGSVIFSPHTGSPPYGEKHFYDTKWTPKSLHDAIGSI